MSELRSSEPDRIDELLGSLQESRTPHAPAGTPVPPTQQHRRKSRVWIVFAVVAAVAASVVFLLLQGRQASLNIRSFPSGATVFLDEQQVGTTPLVLSRVAPGTHAIQIRPGWLGDLERHCDSRKGIHDASHRKHDPCRLFSGRHIDSAWRDSTAGWNSQGRHSSGGGGP